MKAETGDGNIDRRQCAEHPHALERQRDLLVRFAQRRLLEGFARLDDAARQRHLAAVPAERLRAHRQHDVRAIADRKTQQQARRLPNARRD